MMCGKIETSSFSMDEWLMNTSGMVSRREAGEQTSAFSITIIEAKRPKMSPIVGAAYGR